MFYIQPLKRLNLLRDLISNSSLICKCNRVRVTSLASRITPEVYLWDNRPNLNFIKHYSKDTTKVTKAEQYSQEASSKKKSLQGGVTVIDVALGNGASAKSGKTVTVYYSGRLKANNELFDAMTSGLGLTFRLGRGEVIDGWDVGLVGMKVGGKRVITCPPNMAYGARGFPPKIPPNSTLVFEVELKAVK